MTPIASLFSNVNLDKDVTGDESTLVKRHPNDSDFLDLDAKIDKSGIGVVKTLGSNEPTLLDFKDINYDNFSLIYCISLFQSMLNAPHAYNQNKTFTNFCSKNSEFLERFLGKGGSYSVPSLSRFILQNKDLIGDTLITFRSSSLFSEKLEEHTFTKQSS